MILLRKARFHLSLWTWARLLPFMAWNRDLRSLVRLTEAGPGVPYRGLRAGYIVRRVQHLTCRPMLMRDRPCLRRGLLAMRFLRLAGYHPQLHFGVERTSVARDVLSAHCWITLTGELILSPELDPATSTLIEVVSYTDDGLLPAASRRVALPLA
jgi:transglutaminase superfamily protein